jgi:hypothetical protein
MLPAELHGPALTLAYAGADRVSEFLHLNQHRYPHLDRDFILQICFEHPDRFNGLFPRFNIELHSAVRITRSAAWINNNVRYDRGETVDFWCDRFHSLLARDETSDEVFVPMLRNGTWHFPPVVIESNFALSLGAPGDIGTPYYLIEGTHRLSYLRAMLELEMISSDRELPLIAVQPRNGSDVEHNEL